MLLHFRRAIGIVPNRRMRFRVSGRAVARWIAAIVFVLAGANHFVNPAFYERIIPPAFPSPAMLVAVSGVAEIVGGVGLLITPVRRWAGWGLIALLVAVFPANIFMAMHADRFVDSDAGRVLLWLRLPLQIVLMAWVGYVGEVKRVSPTTNTRLDTHPDATGR